MPRSTRSTQSSPHGVDEAAKNPLLTKLSHGWYTEETLINVLGEDLALELLSTVSKGAQNGYVLISDVAKDTGQNHGTVVYYLRYPQMRSFEPIRVSACVWMKFCRTLSPLIMFKGFEQLELYSGEVIRVSPNNHLLKFLLRYGGVGEVDKIPREVILEVLLELLGNFKLVGVSPIQQAPRTPESESGGSFPSSAGGYAPKTVRVGPFVELRKRSRNPDGTFVKSDLRLQAAIGRFRASMPQQGIPAVTHSLAEAMTLSELGLEIAMPEQLGMYAKFDLSGLIPTSPDTYAKCTRAFASVSLLRFVAGVIENGGWIAMSADGGKRLGRNLFPCSASFFDEQSSPQCVQYSVITCGNGGSTGEDAGRVILDALKRMSCMRECMIEANVLSKDCAKLTLAHC